MALEINSEVIGYIHDHCEDVYPNEGCGFFFGKDGDKRTVSQAVSVPNVNKGDQRRRFRIDPNDYRKAEKFAGENDLDLLGVYHSHPDHPAVPSEHDLRVALPYFSYIIVSVRNGVSTDVRSWKLNEHHFDEEPIEIPKYQ